MKRILYLGTDPTHFETQGHLVHYPVIKIVPRSCDEPEIKSAYENLEHCTHILFTSKNAVRVFVEHLLVLNQSLKDQKVIAIGQVTAMHAKACGFVVHHTSQNETQEGIVQLLSTLDLQDAFFFLPRSSLSRPVLTHFFAEKNIRYQACDVYDTVTQVTHPKPHLDEIDEIVFTSPSTVRAFVEIFQAIPHGKKCLAMGPITTQALMQAMHCSAP